VALERRLATVGHLPLTTISLVTVGHFIIADPAPLQQLTPLTKASLSYFITARIRCALNFKIGEFLHATGKWSMAMSSSPPFCWPLRVEIPERQIHSVPWPLILTGYCL